MALVVDSGRWCCSHMHVNAHHASVAPRLVHIQKCRSWCVGGRQLMKLESILSLNVLPNLNPRTTPRCSEIDRNIEVSEEDQIEEQRVPFDLDVAVLLAGFAFESYNTPSSSEGVHEVDGADCQTVYLTKEFVQEIYDGQLVVKLNKGSQFPGLDLWGTSDPYVVLRIGDCSVRTRTVWATKDPVWNEDLTLNIRTSAGQHLQVAAWDANLVTAHRRLGNASISLGQLCDGLWHSMKVKLEGMGGGGDLFFDVQFQSFAQVVAEKSQFSLSGFFNGELLGNAFKSIFEASDIKVGEFMKYFQSCQSNNLLFAELDNMSTEDADIVSSSPGEQRQGSEIKRNGVSMEKASTTSEALQKGAVSKPTHDNFVDRDGEVKVWQKLAETFSQSLKPFGIDVSGYVMNRNAWDPRDDLKSLGLESQKQAEVLYAECGLAVVDNDVMGNDLSKEESQEKETGKSLNPLPAEKQALEDLRKQTEGILGIWSIVNKSLGAGESSRENAITETKACRVEEADGKTEESQVEETKTAVFSTAESAMEAWALLSTTLGGTSLVKSDFEKICFVNNEKTDTQAAIWRDLRRRRLVVAFRGTEQTKWKDVVTDLNLLGAGFNPERVTGGITQTDEALVHSGFLKAYDSVRSRLMSLVRASLDCSYSNNCSQKDLGWHAYITGHSLGGALATLFALELSTSKLAKYGHYALLEVIAWVLGRLDHSNHPLTRDCHLQVSMYNYGSPRVGNRSFAKNYNKVVKDSWRVVNHRDIVPTVPRLMGYCHVAQPVYLTAEPSTLIQSELLDDGYQGDVIGEATPIVLIDKFMNGEQKILERLLDTEIAMLRAMRDGSAVMQHMEDFYYITLLQRVESRIIGRKNV